MAAIHPAAPAVSPLSYPPTATGKRTMPVRHVRADSDANELAEKLAGQHPSLLGPAVVSNEQLARLTAKLVQHKQMVDLKQQQEHEKQVRQALM